MDAVYPGNLESFPRCFTRDRLKVLSLLAGSFFLGGVVGALGFKGIGYIATVPLALVLVTLAIVPAVDDLRLIFRRFQRG